MIFIAMAAVAAIMANLFARYLQGWHKDKKICLGHTVSRKYLDFANVITTPLLWLSLFLGLGAIAGMIWLIVYPG